MPSLDYVQLLRGVDLRHRVVVPHRDLGQRAQRVQPRDAVGGLLDAVDVRRNHVAYLAEVAVFEVVYPVLRRQERIFELLQLLREVALVRYKRLLAYVVGGDVFKPRGFRHVDIVAEHLVVADLELLYARALALALLQLRDHLRAVVADVAQLVDLLGVALAQYTALADGERRLVAYRAVYLGADIVQRVHRADVAQFKALEACKQLLQPRKLPRAVCEHTQIAPARRAVDTARGKALHVAYLAHHERQFRAVHRVVIQLAHRREPPLYRDDGQQRPLDP